jgi:hypothetical protein
LKSKSEITIEISIHKHFCLIEILITTETMGDDIAQYRLAVGSYLSKARIKSQPSGPLQCGCNAHPYPDIDYTKISFLTRGDDETDPGTMWYFTSIWLVSAYMYKIARLCQTKRYRSEQLQLQQRIIFDKKAEKWFARVLANHKNKMEMINLNDYATPNIYECDQKTNTSDRYFKIEFLLPLLLGFILYVGYQFYKFNLLQLNNNVESNPGPVDRYHDIRIRKVTLGCFHQGSERYSETSIGKQCVANAAAALMYSLIVKPYHWESQDLDDILDEGDSWYRTIKSTIPAIGYLAIDQLPSYRSCFGEHFKLKCVGVSQNICLNYIENWKNL